MCFLDKTLNFMHPNPSNIALNYLFDSNYVLNKEVANRGHEEALQDT